MLVVYLLLVTRASACKLKKQSVHCNLTVIAVKFYL